MAWRLAKSLEALREQINDAAPNRSKVSDGTIGDAAHASRSSDHNPWVKDGGVGVVRALDITHDPAHGIDCNTIAEALRAANDPRIKYIIWDRRIWTPAKAKSWRPYAGKNPHTKHLHLSVSTAKLLYDGTAPWAWGGPSSAPSSAHQPHKPTLHPGIVGQDAHVTDAKARLVKALAREAGFGPLLEGLVRGFQEREALNADGKIGPYSWERLDEIA